MSGALRSATRGVAMLLGLALLLAAIDLAFRLREDLLVGPARIVDGDTVEIAGVNVRLAGLDAPERAQLCKDARGREFGCGTAATDYLTFLVDEAPVTCRGRGRDRYGRMIGHCRANGVDLSEAMIRRGWAVAYLGELDAVEREARERKVGMWAGEFVRPADWRRDRRSAALGTQPLGTPALGSTVGAARELIARLAARLAGAPVARAPADG